MSGGEVGWEGLPTVAALGTQVDPIQVFFQVSPPPHLDLADGAFKLWGLVHQHVKVQTRPTLQRLVANVACET